MTLRIVRKGERVPTRSMERDGSCGGYIRRQAECDGVAVDGPDAFITREELVEALKELDKKR